MRSLTTRPGTLSVLIPLQRPLAHDGPWQSRQPTPQKTFERRFPPRTGSISENPLAPLPENLLAPLAENAMAPFGEN